MMRSFLSVLFVLLAGVCAHAGAEANWPQFRGPGGQGVSDAAHLPLHWGEGQNVKWKTAIHGKAWSSPVIWGDQVWMTTATEDGHELSVVCVDKGSGKITLDKVLFHIQTPQYCIPFNSYASPTPCIEAGRLYATFGAPGTACVDTKDGTVLWQRTDFVCNHFRGAGSSPLLWNDRLIMNFDGSDFQYVVALDKQTGKTIWNTPRSIDFQDMSNGKPMGGGDFRKAFSSPRIMMYEGKPILISEGSKAVYCYDPMTGKELWRTEYRAAHSGSITPVIGEGLVYVTTGHSATELWALRPGGHGVVNETHIVWKNKKHVPTRPSPVLADGLIYMTSDSGIASCVDAKTGAEVWHGRLDARAGGFSASPIYAPGRVYFFNEEGKTTVLAAGREFKALAENQLADGIMGSPAVSGDALFLRTKTSLYRIEDTRSASASGATQKD
ncbi:MAG TPA: PQQ-binding-like beta-propeller repeat protein [Tepidisphaeraceae bacterium]|nr:PQQ-binding-like beta-propeller repeat protein [Tepidisphaeraceae bacterium]